MTITISKQYKYLGQVPEFKENGLPSGFLIDKGKVGCGGTSLALEDDRDTIVYVPFVSLLNSATLYLTLFISACATKSYPGFCHVRIFTYLSVAKRRQAKL